MKWNSNLIEINEHVIICLHNKLCLITKFWDPEVSHDGLVGEVVVRVQEVTMDNVPMLIVLIYQHCLLLIIFRAAEKEDKLCDNTRNVWVTPWAPYIFLWTWLIVRNWLSVIYWPDHRAGINVVNCCVYNCDQSDPLNIANVVVDDKFEICNVDKR